jgi:hypothetical protein
LLLVDYLQRYYQVFIEEDPHLKVPQKAALTESIIHSRISFRAIIFEMFSAITVIVDGFHSDHLLKFLQVHKRMDGLPH